MVLDGDASPADALSAPVKIDRDEVFVEYTKSICRVCTW